MVGPPLDIPDHQASVGFIPAPVQVLCYAAQLDDEVAREVLGFDFSAFLLPEAEKGRFIATHDHSRIGAADKRASVVSRKISHFQPRKKLRIA